MWRVSVQRGVHVDEFAGRGGRAGRQRERSAGPGAVDYERRAGRASFDCGRGGGRRPGRRADQFARRKATYASARRFSGRSIGSNLRRV